jgi:hypothetical protein
MAVKKEHVFTLTAALNIVKAAVTQTMGTTVQNIDKTVFNSLIKAIDNKKGAK